MEEYKFRVFNIKTKDMVYFDFQKIKLNCFSMREVADIDNPKNPKMQYIGCKDKNGKDIYSGDIVRVLIPKYDNGKEIYEVFITGVVVYTEYALFAIEDLTGKQLSFYYFENCLIEIVGNNYEGLKLVKERLT